MYESCQSGRVVGIVRFINGYDKGPTEREVVSRRVQVIVIAAVLNLMLLNLM